MMKYYTLMIHVCFRNHLECNRRAEFLYKQEKEQRRNAQEDLMHRAAGEVMDLSS